MPCHSETQFITFVLFQVDQKNGKVEIALKTSCIA